MCVCIYIFVTSCAYFFFGVYISAHREDPDLVVLFSFERFQERNSVGWESRAAAAAPAPA